MTVLTINEDPNPLLVLWLLEELPSHATAPLRVSEHEGAKKNSTRL